MKRRVLITVASLAMAVLASCTMGPKSGLPCDDCRFGVATQKAQPPRVFCVVNGKEVDCRKSPAECPECVPHKR